MEPVVIINPAAGARRGSGAERTRIVRHVFERLGVRGHVVLTERPGHASRLAIQAREDRATCVVAWGGDGTINEIASALAFSDVPLGIVLAGSGNGLARELGVPRDPKEALEIALGGGDRRIDAGELAGRLFFNVAGVGFDATVVERINARRAGRGGLVRYVLGSVRAFARYQPLTYEVDAGGAPFRSRALFIAIANGRQYGHGALIAPDARLDDGLLDVVIAHTRSLWRGALDARRLFTGEIGRVPGMTLRRVTELTIATDCACLAHVDGEGFLAGDRVTARVHPGALRVRVRTAAPP